MEEFKLSSSASALLQVGITLFLGLCSTLEITALGTSCACRAAFTHTHPFAPRSQKAGPELLQ